MKVFKPFLWSYDTKKMDMIKDKERIITNVLNKGTYEATKLLFKVYDLKTIKSMVRNPLPGDWSKKSLNFWSIILGVTPKNRSRGIPKDSLKN